MCLGIPMRIITMDGLVARCEAKGAERDVNLLMLQHEELKPQDYVVVHLGFAIEKITPEEASKRFIKAVNKAMKKGAASS